MIWKTEWYECITKITKWSPIIHSQLMLKSFTLKQEAHIESQIKAEYVFRISHYYFIIMNTFKEGVQVQEIQGPCLCCPFCSHHSLITCLLEVAAQLSPLTLTPSQTITCLE